VLLEVVDKLMNAAAKLNFEGKSKEELAVMTKVNIEITVFQCSQPLYNDYLPFLQALVDGIEVPQLVLCVEALAKKKHEGFANQLQRTPTLLAEMLLRSGSLSSADTPCTPRFMDTASFVVWTIHWHKPSDGAFAALLRTTLGALDKTCCRNLLSGIAFMVNNILFHIKSLKYFNKKVVKIMLKVLKMKASGHQEISPVSDKVSTLKGNVVFVIINFF
jgi:hypothetical protein